MAIMCKAMEDMRNKAAREAEKMKAIRMARLMIEDGKLSYEDIANVHRAYSERSRKNCYGKETCIIDKNKINVLLSE